MHVGNALVLVGLFVTFVTVVFEYLSLGLDAWLTLGVGLVVGGGVLLSTADGDAGTPGDRTTCDDCGAANDRTAPTCDYCGAAL